MKDQRPPHLWSAPPPATHPGPGERALREQWRRENRYFFAFITVILTLGFTPCVASLLGFGGTKCP